ncbi:hypothetical protein BGZ83_009509 [Gryganskiella cystojenkinii]|nr:hypothetical protein BGZ83_009509 [Gryganskiella cystojenkinii]
MDTPQWDRIAGIAASLDEGKGVHYWHSWCIDEGFETTPTLETITLYTRQIVAPLEEAINGRARRDPRYLPICGVKIFIEPVLGLTGRIPNYRPRERSTFVAVAASSTRPMSPSSPISGLPSPMLQSHNEYNKSPLVTSDSTPTSPGLLNQEVVIRDVTSLSAEEGGVRDDRDDDGQVVVVKDTPAQIPISVAAETTVIVPLTQDQPLEDAPLQEYKSSPCGTIYPIIPIPDIPELRIPRPKKRRYKPDKVVRPPQPSIPENWEDESDTDENTVLEGHQPQEFQLTHTRYKRQQLPTQQQQQDQETPLQDTIMYELSDDVKTVLDVLEEWRFGFKGGPPIQDLLQSSGARWKLTKDKFKFTGRSAITRDQDDDAEHDEDKDENSDTDQENKVPYQKVPLQQQREHGKRVSTAGMTFSRPIGEHHPPPLQNGDSFPFPIRDIHSIPNIWKEWAVGWKGQPSIESLISIHGTLWKQEQYKPEIYLHFYYKNRFVSMIKEVVR